MKRSIHDIVRAAAVVTGVPVHVLKGKVRNKPETNIRSAICKVGLALGLSHPKIGIGLERDHTTILHLAGIDRPEIEELTKAMERQLEQPTTFEKAMGLAVNGPAVDMPGQRDIPDRNALGLRSLVEVQPGRKA